jgi:hypothetical protein
VSDPSISQSVAPSKNGSSLGTPRPRKNWWQVRLRSLFLVMAAIGVWTAFFTNRQRIASLESGIAAMRPLTRELIIKDENSIAVVKMEELWYDENQWEIYLPSGQYRLFLATREIDKTGLAPVLKSESVMAGKHRLALEQRDKKGFWQVMVTWDGAPLMTAEEAKDWYPGTGSEGGGEFSQSTKLPVDEPVIFFRRRFTRLDANRQTITPPGPTEGVLLWLERE